MKILFDFYKGKEMRRKDEHYSKSNFQILQINIFNAY